MVRMAVLTAVLLALVSGTAEAQIIPTPTPTPTSTPAPSGEPPVVDPGPLGASTTHLYGDAARRGAIAAGGLRPPLRSLWRHDFDALISSAVVGGGRAYVYSGGRVTAIELGTGRKLWTSAAEVGGGLAYGGGKVVALGDDGLIALDAVTGVVAWSASGDTTTFSSGSPLIAGNLVIVQHQGMRAYDLATGALRWRGGTSDGVSGEPAAAGDRIYQFGGCTIVAVDRRDGDVLWSRNSGCSGGTSGTVAVNGTRVHSSFGNVPLAASDGRDAPGPKADIFAGGIGLQRSSEGLAAVDLAAGRLLWRTEADDSVINDTLGAPLVVGDTLFQTRFEGTLQARALATGAVAWQGRLREAKETFTGSDSASDFAQAAGDGVLVVLRGSTVDGLGAAPVPPSSLAIAVPKPAKRLVEAGVRQTVRGRAKGDLLPGGVRVQKDPYPFGRFKAAGKAVAPDEKGRYLVPVKTDRNARVRLVGTFGSAAPTRAYVLYAYPRIRIGVRNVSNRVTARIRVSGSKAIRYRGRRVHLYIARGKRERMVKLGTARLSGPKRARGRATVRFRALQRVGSRDFLFACVPRVHRLGQGAPDRVQRRCGRGLIRY